MHKALPQNKHILLAASVAFFLAFLLLTIFRSSFHTIDVQVNAFTPTIRSSLLTTLTLGVALIFETNSLVLISIVISVVLLLKQRKQLGLLLFGAMGGDALLVATLKAIDQVDRPTNGIYAAMGFSYPSGHSAAVVVLIGILSYLVLRRYHSMRAKAAVGMGLGVLVGVVGFDRIYLNVHWFSDMLGGWLFGAFWLTFAVSGFVWLESAGKLRSTRFSAVANWLYVVAVLLSVLVVASGSIA